MFYATATGANPLSLTSDYGLVTPGFLPVGYLQSTVATPEPTEWAIALTANGHGFGHSPAPQKLCGQIG